MAIKTSSNSLQRLGSVIDLAVHRSDIEVIADTIILDGLDSNLGGSCIGAEFFSDAAGTPVVPGAGTVALKMKTIVTKVFEDAPNTPIDATAAATKRANFAIEAIQGIPAAITVATHWRLSISQMRN